MKKIIKSIKELMLKNRAEGLLLFLILTVAIFLRFYHIARLEFFTYDQARDALFVKRMIVDREFRLLGTQTSLPGMYLPPFYYYTIAVVLWLFRLNPAGIDIYSGLIGVLSIPLVYYVANKIFGKPAGMFSAGLFAVSPIIVELTRRAWNCNTLPFFILIAFYFVYLYFKERKVRDFLLAFTFYGYSLSLHFGAWTLIPLFIYIWFYALIKNKLKTKWLLTGAGIAFFFISPLLIFELRHNFILVNQAKMFFFDGGHLGAAPGNFWESLISSLISIFTILISGKITVGYGAPLEFSGKFKEFFTSSQQISVVAQKPFSLTYQWWGTGVFLLIFFYSIYIFYKNFKLNKERKTNDFLPLLLIWIWILWGVFASRIYSGKFFFFYYLYLFPAPILLFGYLCKKGWENKWLRLPLFLVVLAIVSFHVRFTTVFATGWRNISDLKNVAKIIAQNTPEGIKFNIATIQKDADRWDRNSVDYRYFVETYFKKVSLDWYPENYREAEELFVVSEGGTADVLKSNIMEITEFYPSNILAEWRTEKGIVIYKLGKK